jgi:hypothetical protein
MGPGEQKLVCSGGCTMPATLRRWEVSFAVSRSHDPNYFGPTSVICLYGETVDALRAEVSTFLKAYQPSYFDNHGDHVVGLKMYAYSNGKRTLPREWEAAMEEGKEEYKESFKQQEGWWGFSTRLVSGHEKLDEMLPYPFHLGSFEDAVGDFLTSALIPRKGPDYQSRAMVDNQLQLPLLETVLREADEYSLNDLLRRGWHILALEYQGEVSKMGELTNRKAIFVLGHADLPAALSTLEARDFAYYHTYS